MAQGDVGIYASQISGHLWAPSGAYDALATVTVPSGGAASVEFTGIPTGYKHLQIRYIAQNTVANYFVKMQFNSDTGTRYATHYLNGNGSTASASASTSDTGLYLPRTNTSNFSGGIVDVLDYASVNKNKTTRAIGGFDANGSGHVDFNSGLWMPASLSSGNITSIKFILEAGNYAQYSQFALYGVK